METQKIIYKVLTQEHYGDTNIEQYICKLYLFTSKLLAIDYAYILALNNVKKTKTLPNDNININKNINKNLLQIEKQLNVSDTYTWYGEYYFEYRIKVEEDSLNFNNDIINVTQFNL